MIPYTARLTMLSGIPGCFTHEGPKRAAALLVDKTSTEANNVFGRAFTYTDEDSETVVAGGEGVFAGIMVHPHAYAIDRDTVLNGTVSEFAQMGEICVAMGTDSATRGMRVGYLPTTGVLVAMGETGAEDAIEIQGAVVSRHPVSAEKDSDGRVLAFITLNGPLPVPAPAAETDPGTGG